MHRRLRDKDIQNIVSILDGWSGPITWDRLIVSIETRLQMRLTRQALDRHKRISDAYKVTKRRLRNLKDSGEAISQEMRRMKERLSRLEAENKRLEKENNNLLDQFRRWAYNAHTKGLDEIFLNQPLPSVNR